MNNLLKEKSKFTYSLKVKTAHILQDLHVKMPFCQKVVILTKIRPKIRLFWKKSLISDHGLLKRTIVGTLDMSTLTDKKYVKKTGILLTVFFSELYPSLFLTLFHLCFQDPELEVIFGWFPPFKPAWPK